MAAWKFSRFGFRFGTVQTIIHFFYFFNHSFNVQYVCGSRRRINEPSHVTRFPSWAYFSARGVVLPRLWAVLLSYMYSTSLFSFLPAGYILTLPAVTSWECEIAATPPFSFSPYIFLVLDRCPTLVLLRVAQCVCFWFVLFSFILLFFLAVCSSCWLSATSSTANCRHASANRAVDRFLHDDDG